MDVRQSGSRAERWRHRGAGWNDAARRVGPWAHTRLHRLDDQRPRRRKDLLSGDLRMRRTERRCEAGGQPALPDARGRHARDLPQAEEAQTGHLRVRTSPDALRRKDRTDEGERAPASAARCRIGRVGEDARRCAGGVREACVRRARAVLQSLTQKELVMASINLGRVVAGGLVAGGGANAIDFVTHTYVLAADWAVFAPTRNLDPAAFESGSVAAAWITIDFIFGLLLVFTYAAMRPRFGAGPKTAILDGLALCLTR